MNENQIEHLNFILQFIQIDIFNAFAIFTLLFLVLKIFINKNSRLYKFDEKACRFIVFAGVIYGIVYLIVYTNYVYSVRENYQIEQFNFYKRTTPFALVYWFRFFILIILSQLLRFKTFRNNPILRMIIASLFMVSFEGFIIIIASFHNDFLPSSWLYFIPSFADWGFYGLHLLVKLALFSLYVWVYACLAKIIKNTKAIYA